ncbi:MAG: hypothetical protein KAT70_03955 [Thermoplasmata archaeon]|nr:hypothetical protein [Thermoplasmata archaeon]
MVPNPIPIYPHPDDLVFLIDAMIDVAGAYSRGILFRFGTQVGEKYARRVMDEGMINENAAGPILGMLQASGWFEESSFERKGNEVVVRILNPFELSSREKECDFMRGFLAGIGNVLDDMPTFYEEEREGEWVMFIGKISENIEVRR